MKMSRPCTDWEDSTPSTRKRSSIRDGSVDVIYILAEQPLINAIQVVGNREISDQKLLRAIPLYAGGPRDDFLLEQGVIQDSG